MKQRVLQKQRFLAAIAMLFLFSQANSDAATIVLRRPVSLQPETVTHLRQAHAGMAASGNSLFLDLPIARMFVQFRSPIYPC